MANVLPESKQVAIINALVEGCSVRSTERMVDVSRETVLSLLVRAGEGCAKFHDDTVRGMVCDRLELDELWAFVAKKQRSVMDGDADREVVGDAWTFVAFDPDTKLVASYLVGKRTYECTAAFVADLASRIVNRPQITTDGLSLYVGAIEEAFGSAVDYAQIVKEYESTAAGAGRYSPPKVVAVKKTVIQGSPDEEKISTSLVERQNLNVRMATRRYTRLTNAFSKSLRNHRAATALYFAFYNYCRTHGTTRVTPAMAAGLTDHVWSTTELLHAALHGVRP